MRKLTIEMPVVARCSVTTCAYNVTEACHARAITVGDGQRPGCDTFFPASHHTLNAMAEAGVGACKVTGCKYNAEYECMAEGIEVAQTANDQRCVTFEPRLAV